MSKMQRDIRYIEAEEKDIGELSALIWGIHKAPGRLHSSELLSRQKEVNTFADGD